MIDPSLIRSRVVYGNINIDSLRRLMVIVTFIFIFERQ